MNNIRELYKVNPEFLQSKKKCIFGTGIHAKQTYVELSVQGIKIDFFADRENQKDFYMGLPVISESELRELNVSVIIASTSWQDIAHRLLLQGITDLYVDLHRYGEIEIQNGYLCSVGKYAMKSDTLYLLCPAGIGDTLYVAAFAKEMHKYCEEMKRICLIVKESHGSIAMFFEGVDEIISSNQLVEQLELYSITTQTWNLKNYIYGHFKKNLCQTFNYEWYCNTDKNIISFYKKKILMLPESAQLEKLKLPALYKEPAFPEEKAVILMPYAVTVPLLSKTFWNELAESILSRGYTVYTNVKDETEKPIEGTYSLSESIANTAAMCAHAKIVISLRSGMCDVLAMTSARLVILNTDETCTTDWDVTVGIRKNGIENLRCYGDYSINEIKDKILGFLST